METPPADDLSQVETKDLLEKMKNQNFNTRQITQKELRNRGIKILLELREAMTDCRDSEQVHRLENLIQTIQIDIDLKEKTSRLERQKTSIESEIQEIQATLEIWEQKLRQLRPTEGDCQIFIENWQNIQQYLFWLREKLNYLEIRRAAIKGSEN